MRYSPTAGNGSYTVAPVGAAWRVGGTAVPRWIVENVSVRWLTAIALVCLPALTMALQYVIRHRSPGFIDGHQNEAVGYQGAVVGVVYAIIVGFMVITLWDQYTSAGDTVQAETSDLRDLAQFSQAFGPAAHGRVQGQVAAYAESVATSEWRTMARGAASPAAQQDFDRLIDTVQRLRVRSLSEQEFLGSMLTQINDIGEERQQRLDLASQNIPGVLWLVVILSSAGTLAFSLLLGIRSAWLHYFMVGAVAVLIGASLVLALELEYPFSGTVAVHPELFEQVAHDLRTGLPGS
jgi:hypothetical protein